MAPLTPILNSSCIVSDDEQNPKEKLWRNIGSPQKSGFVTESRKLPIVTGNQK